MYSWCADHIRYHLQMTLAGDHATFPWGERDWWGRDWWGNRLMGKQADGEGTDRQTGWPTVRQIVVESDEKSRKVGDRKIARRSNGLPASYSTKKHPFHSSTEPNLSNLGFVKLGDRTKTHLRWRLFCHASMAGASLRFTLTLFSFLGARFNRHFRNFSKYVPNQIIFGVLRLV